MLVTDPCCRKAVCITTSVKITAVRVLRGGNLHIPIHVLAFVAGGGLFLTLVGLLFRKRLRNLKKTTSVACPTVQLPAEIGLGSDGRIESCSRWPRLEDCSQTCTPQLQFSAENLSEFVAKYEGRSCTSCGTVLTGDDWYRSRLAIPTAHTGTPGMHQGSSSSSASTTKNRPSICFTCWDRGFRGPTSPATSPR
jgi:hypothetical protein